MRSVFAPGLQERQDSRPGQRVPTACRTTTIDQRHIGQIEEAAVAHGLASLCHLDRGRGGRGRRHCKAAAGDGDGGASIDATSIDELLKGRVERHFRSGVGFGPRLLRRARPRKAVGANVENLRRRGAEAGIEHEVEVRTRRGVPRRQLSTPTPSPTLRSNVSCPRRICFRLSLSGNRASPPTPLRCRPSCGRSNPAWSGPEWRHGNFRLSITHFACILVAFISC